MVNMSTSSLDMGWVSTCWCQVSNGRNLFENEQPGAGWATCKLGGEDAPVAEPEPVSSADACEGPWVDSNYFTTDERNIGAQPNKGECTRQVLIQCPGYDLANVNDSCMNGGEC